MDTTILEDQIKQIQSEIDGALNEISTLHEKVKALKKAKKAYSDCLEKIKEQSK